LYVPAVFPEMSRNAVGPRLLTEHGRGHRIGLGAATRLPDRGDVVDVHIEALVAKRRHWGIR
jgi:hypothetical protein